MEMSSTRNWSVNSFERAMEYFTPILKAEWMTYMKIIPINYSDWSDTLYVAVEFDVTPDAEIILMEMTEQERDKFSDKLQKYIREYIRVYFNTNIGVKEYRRPENYHLK